MESKSTILKILNIEKNEVKYVLWTVLYSFFLGAAIAYFFTGSTSLFLSSFEKDMVSLSFVIAGFIVIGVGQLYSFLQRKNQFSYTNISALAFLLISVITFFVLFTIFQSVILIFALYAWNRIIAYIHNVVFWGMAGKLFSLQQAKRVFGLISGGEVLGLILAFFSVPFLLKFLQTEDLLFISMLFLFAGFLVFIYISKTFNVKFAQAGNKTTKIKTDVKAKKTGFLSNNYYKLFFLIAFLPIFAQFFVDFIFQAQLKLEYPDKESLSSFVGIFFGIGAVIEFFMKAFASGRLLSKFGMRFGLLAFPVVMVISLLLATLFGFIYGAISMFFSFIALARLFTRSVRTSFNDPATQLLYQPLPADERIAFQNKVESGPKAYASIVAGILLLIFAKIPGINLVYFSLFLLVISGFWMIAADRIYKEYRNVLQSILSGKTDTNKQEGHPIIRKIALEIQNGNIQRAKSISRLSKIILPFETDSLSNQFPELSENKYSDKLKFNKIIELTKSENPSERIAALKQMHNYSIYKIEKPLIRLLHDEEFEVKCEAITTAARMKETELFYHLVTFFKIPEFKTTVSKSMIHIGPAILSELDNNFQKTEYDVDLQIITIDLFGQIGGEKAIDFLKRNINHHIKSVNDKIIQTLVLLKYKANTNESLQIWQKLENEIKNYVFVTSAIYNLKGQINDSSLFESLELEKKDKKRKIFAILSLLYDTQAIALIEENLESGDKNARGFALEIAEILLTDIHKPLLSPLLESESDTELLQKYMLYFPSGKLSVIDQLIDIINSEQWVIGMYAKAAAIKLISNIKDNKIWPILMANIVHPKPMMWQLAAYCIYQRDKDIFTQEIYQNFPKVPGLKEFSLEIQNYENGNKLLIYSKLIKIKSIGLFSEIPENELIDLASNSTDQKLQAGEHITFYRKSGIYTLIAEGSLKDASGEKIHSKGKILCLYLQHEEDKLDFVANDRDTIIISFKMYHLNSFIIKYPVFSDKLIDLIWNIKDENDIPLNETIANTTIDVNL